jgi:hypothetical protein
MALRCRARVSHPHGFPREKQLRTVELCLVRPSGLQVAPSLLADRALTEDFWHKSIQYLRYFLRIPFLPLSESYQNMACQPRHVPEWQREGRGRV